MISREPLRKLTELSTNVAPSGGGPRPPAHEFLPSGNRLPCRLAHTGCLSRDSGAGKLPQHRGPPLLANVDEQGTALFEGMSLRPSDLYWMCILRLENSGGISHLAGVNYSCAAATIRTVQPSSLLPSPSRGPVGCGKRVAFSKGCGRVPGAGWGRQPSIPRQTAGRGDGGAGGRGGAFRRGSAENPRFMVPPACWSGLWQLRHGSSAPTARG